MKTNSTQQEILILTGTRFASRLCLEKNDPLNLSELEQLEEACCNGLLHEFLPEICKPSVDGKDIYLWQVTEADSFIELELGEFPEEKEKYFSIDPYRFLSIQVLS